MKWFLYILRCSDNSLYTGITMDIERRIREHNTDNKKGSKSLRGKRPVSLLYSEEFNSRSAASKREYAVKGLKRAEKLELVELSQKHHSNAHEKRA